MKMVTVVARILVVDKKQSFRFMVKGYLEDSGFNVACAVDGEGALTVLERGGIDLVLSDLVMPDMDGMALLQEVRRRFPRLPFLLITAHGCVNSAVAAMKEGAHDYLLKPLHQEELILTVKRNLERAQLRLNHDRMEGLLNECFTFQHIRTVSPAMSAVLTAARQVAAFPRTTVTIYGESGTGKEVLARAIHMSSGSPPASFVPVNCAAIPESLLESELFGHVKGAFTGADYERAGKCQRALGGTLFLDEIGDMSLSLQTKLLRVLEEKIFESVGSDIPRAANFRIISATHQNLKKLSEQGNFRSDLFYRLDVFPLTLPPLRERKVDILHLAEHFLETFQLDQGKPFLGLSNAALELLLTHHWPGNVRELRNSLEYATIVANCELIQPEDFRLPANTTTDVSNTKNISLYFNFTTEEFSYERVVQDLKNWAMQQTGNNKSAAARLLKTTRKRFY